jgi:hypothetical protein
MQRVDDTCSGGWPESGAEVDRAGNEWSGPRKGMSVPLEELATRGAPGWTAAGRLRLTPNHSPERPFYMDDLCGRDGSEQACRACVYFAACGTFLCGGRAPHRMFAECSRGTPESALDEGTTMESATNLMVGRGG